MKRLLVAILPLCMVACMPLYISKTYYGEPWKLQNIPGKIECEFYDKGGEAVAYHDADSINNGSGKLNPANGNYLNEFRMKEGVDISYTKTNNVDNNPFNKREPSMKQLYVGWTQPGEWIRYTVKVKEAGNYRVALMYTANGDGSISIDIDNMQAAGPSKISSTHNDADTVAWRQWHHWNKVDSLTTIQLKKGLHLLTLHVVENGNMNFDYLEFVKE
ncbi:MAG TPA: carbohydrate-binding protein [Chitinophagaceae bacterium]|nr:carbohydrate-binding protein [Chitinophagaceae bacterium]